MTAKSMVVTFQYYFGISTIRYMHIWKRGIRAMNIIRNDVHFKDGSEEIVAKCLEVVR